MKKTSAQHVSNEFKRLVEMTKHERICFREHIDTFPPRAISHIANNYYKMYSDRVRHMDRRLSIYAWIWPICVHPFGWPWAFTMQGYKIDLPRYINARNFCNDVYYKKRPKD